MGVFWYFVYAAWVTWVTLADSVEGKAASFYQTVFLYGVVAVLRAGWVETTVSVCEEST